MREVRNELRDLEAAVEGVRRVRALCHAAWSAHVARRACEDQDYDTDVVSRRYEESVEQLGFVLRLLEDVKARSAQGRQETSSDRPT